MYVGTASTDVTWHLCTIQAVSIATGIVSAIPGASDALGGLLGGGVRPRLTFAYPRYSGTD